MKDEDELNKFLGECDCCHDYFDIFQLRVDEDGQFVYCDKCKSDSGCSSAWQNVSLGD